MTTQERLALSGIVVCLLIVGWLDDQDANLAERYSVAQSGQQIACIH